MELFHMPDIDKSQPSVIKKLVKVKKVKLTTKVKPPQKANDLTKSAIELLTLRGFIVWRNNNGAVYDSKIQRFRKNPQTKLGVPDIVGYEKKTGRAIYVEIKVGADKLSDEQRQFLLEAIANGCIAFECKHIDDVIRRLKMIEEIKNLNFNP